MLLLVVFLLLASPVAAQAPVARDSAGVRIVENPARASAPVVFRLGDNALLDLGGQKTDPDEEFDPRAPLFTVQNAAGGLVVADVSRVMLFDARGKRLRTVGQEGDGPQEFRYISSMCGTRGDTTVAFSAGRLSLLDFSGAIVKTARPASGGIVPVRGCLDDGTILLDFPTLAAGQPTRVRVVRIRTDGTTVNTVGEFTFAPFDMITTVPPSISSAGQRIYVGGGEATEVKVYTPEGKLLEIVRSADPTVRVSPEQEEEVLRKLIPANAPDIDAQIARLRSLPHRDALPGYRTVLVDPSGTLWIEDYNLNPASGDSWTAFDASGRMIGRLVLPSVLSGGNLQAFLKEGALFRVMDNFGFARLMVFPIERTAVAPN